MNAHRSLRSILTTFVTLFATTGIAMATVRCVPNMGVSALCQSGYGTIGAAVSAASAGDTILVGPGTYAEMVSIPTALTGLSLLGTQAGVDPRLGTRTNAAAESVIDASSLSNSTLIVEATNVLIDGFTVQGGVNGNGTGIDLKGNFNTLTPANGAVVLNNIVQNNATGLSLNSEGIPPATVKDVVIHQNLFRNNNAASLGDAIFTSSCQNVTISDNTFTGNLRVSLGINNATGVTISNNAADSEAHFLILTGTSHSAVVRNTGTNLVATVPAAFVEPSQPAYVEVGPGNAYITISNNTFTGGEAASQIRGIDVTPAYGTTPPNTNITISDNSIRSMPQSGIVAEPGMLTNSIIAGNRITGSGSDGIFIDLGNSGNRLTGNVSSGNGGKDYLDNSTGGGTAGTANTWVRDIGVTRTPAGIGQSKTRGDLNGDGTGDLVWRNGTTGENYVWLMSGATINFAAAESAVGDPNFKIVGVGDFDGDGNADLLWRNQSTGDNVIWFMDGQTVVSTAFLGTLSPPWTVAAVGDFNGDGKADIVWRNTTTGDNAMYLMNGAVATGVSLPSVPDTNWQIVGAGDLNGDGTDDLVWRDQTTGSESLWTMNGTATPSTAALPKVLDPNWTIAGVGDINGDGKADIVWRNTVTGDNSAWLMNGATVTTSGSLPPVIGNWSIVRISDLNGDGMSDLVWHNTATGSNSVWFLNGISVVSSATLTSMPTTQWQVGGSP